MARDTDRKKISEALRLQGMWRVEERDRTGVRLVTDFDERLSIAYGNADQIKFATYTHWDRDTGEIVSREPITVAKRARVLHLINQGRGR